MLEKKDKIEVGGENPNGETPPKAVDTRPWYKRKSVWALIGGGAVLVVSPFVSDEVKESLIRLTGLGGEELFEIE